MAVPPLPRAPPCGRIMMYKPSKDICIAENTTNEGMSSSNGQSAAVVITDQTVTFHDDRSVDHNVFPRFVPIDRGVMKSVAEERSHSIKDYLGRPQVVKNGIITTTQVQGDSVVRVNLPDDLLALPMYREKTRGFLGFRATVNLRFQANAQRFQQGRLFITYFPQRTLNQRKFDVVSASLTLSTQLPRVDFDFSTDSDVALSVPYVSPTLGYNQVDGTGPMGTYDVRIYSPLVSPAGPATVDWTLWCWFTDVELDFPAFTPQMSRPKRQMRRLSPSEEEAALANNGPISGIFSRVTRAANIFKDVPLISSVASNVSWVSSILGNTASAFGWSNPDAQNSVHFSKINLAHDIANVNAVGSAVNMGLLSDNKVQAMPGFAGTDVDEMSFNYLTGIPSYVSEFTISTSDTFGAPVWGMQLGVAFMNTISPSGPAYLWPTPMMYIANMFEYWRSGFVYTFKFVKTEFHSGRYVVVFTPGGGIAPLLFSETPYLYREVLDLRISTEFTVTIPYVSTIPYQSAGSNIGRVDVYALNPLVAPTTVSPTVKVLVEVAADDTFEVAVPRIVRYTPVMYTPGTGAPSLDDDVDEVFEPQALGQDVQDSFKESTFMPPAPSIAGVSNDDGGISASSHCVGEKILSLRSLAKRAAPYLNLVAPTTTGTITFRPKIVGLKNASDTITQATSFGVDYVTLTAVLFNYQRGGLKFYAYGPPDYLRIGFAPNRISTVPVTQEVTDTFISSPLAIATGPPIAGGVVVTVPQYSRTHCEMYRFYTAATPLPNDVYCSDLRVYVKANAPFSNLRVLRQAADDWSCGFFTGCIPLFTTSTPGEVVPSF